MAKLVLKANPTFKAKVGIPVAGGDPVQVEMTFKHRTRKEFQDFLEFCQKEETTQTDHFLSMVVGWDLEDALNNESVDLLLENYMGAGNAVFEVYSEELLKHKRKN